VTNVWAATELTINAHKMISQILWHKMTTWPLRSFVRLIATS